MSDHEGCNADEWEEGSLPGGPPLPSVQESLNRPVHKVSNGRNRNYSQRQNDLAWPDGDVYPSGPRNGFRKQNSHQPPSDYRPQIQGLEGRHRGIQARQGKMPKIEHENTAYASFKRQDPPNGHYTFSVTWEMLLKNIPREGLPASRLARDRLDQISATTDTYVPTPLGDTTAAMIFGSEAQVALARQQLELFEKDIRGVSGVRRSNSNWIKMKALDGRREHREEREAQLEEYIRTRFLEDDSIYPFEDYWFWPGEPDLEQFIAEYDMTVMNEIRKKKECRIEYDTAMGFVHTLANSENDLKEVRSRVVNIVREMVAQLNKRLRTNLLNLPSGPMYRSRVGLDRNPSTGLFMPTLHGEVLPENETEDWARLCGRQNKRNRIKVSASVSKTLKSLQVSNSHVRMRVTFGELGFSRHRRPAEGEDSHSFDDFCEMVRNERTELQQQGIRSNTGDISRVVDKLNEMDSLGEPDEAYAVYYDFRTSVSSSTLRLQTEFRPVNGGEIETTGSRWLEFRPDAQSELLEVNMLDFEKPDWQLHIGATQFSNNHRTRTQLAAFQHNLSYRPHTDGIKAPPKRRAVYPPGHRELWRVSELSMLRYRFKNTDGVLELRRTDAYDEQIGQSSARPVSSTWTAAYYYPEWDNLMGEYGWLKPGEQISWHRSLATFFPDDPTDEKPQGFKIFFKEVEEIQELLAEAIVDLPLIKVNGVH